MDTPGPLLICNDLIILIRFSDTVILGLFKRFQWVSVFFVVMEGGGVEMTKGNS